MVVTNDTAPPANEVGNVCPAAVPEQVHEQLKQHAEHMHDELERSHAALQEQAKRAQISAGVVEKLRQELLKKDTTNSVSVAVGTASSLATASSQTTNALDLQDHAQHVQRISALETELHLKDTELQNEMQRVDLLSTSIRALREELQKKGPRTTRSAQVSVEGRSSYKTRRVYKHSLLRLAWWVLHLLHGVGQQLLRPKRQQFRDRAAHPDDRVNMSVDATRRPPPSFRFFMRCSVNRN